MRNECYLYMAYPIELKNYQFIDNLKQREPLTNNSSYVYVMSEQSTHILVVRYYRKELDLVCSFFLFIGLDIWHIRCDK